MSASGVGGVLKRGRDKHLLIEDGGQSPPPQTSAAAISNNTTPSKYSPFNLKGIGYNRNEDAVQVSYNNLGAQVDGEGLNNIRITGVALNGAKPDPSLDISTDSNSSRWSVPSERSWTPSAMKERIVNWPAWMSIKTFVCAICFLIMVHGALSSGYINSVITTIEKRFEIRSKTSGLIVSSYEFGSLLSVLFVSYFGSQGHVPRWIGCGSLLLCISSFLWVIPHWIADSPNINATTDVISYDMCAVDHGVRLLKCSNDEMKDPSAYIFVLILAQIFIGVGGSPIFTLGTTYIDNHVEKEDSSIYLAFMYVFVAIGPVLGFLLGALMLSEYVDSTTPPDMVASNPSWIGRWWAGFILLGVLYFVAAGPFFGFPRHLNSYKKPTDPPLPPPNVTDTASTKSIDSGKSIKQIPYSIFRLITNSVYMIASLSACMDLAIVAGFTVFLPKYLETQFTVSKSLASILTGAVAIPGACVGIFTGGLILKKFKLQLKGVSRFCAVVNLICMFGMALFFVLGCDNINLVGIFQHNTPTTQIEIIDNFNMRSDVNLSEACNANCHCEPKDYQPICGKNNLTYFSPCYAGCDTSVDTGKKETFHDCRCISNTTDPMEDGQAIQGPCPNDCIAKIPFLIYLFFLTLIASLNQMPLIMVTLRAVAEEEKAFALGVQTVLFRLFAYIPAPILFGFIIDTTCLQWKPQCDGDGTTCLLYDIHAFRYHYGSVVMVLKICAGLLSFLLLWCITRRGHGAVPFSPPITMNDIVHQLGVAENLHIRSCKPGLRSWQSDDSLYSRPRSPKRHQKTLSC